MFLALPDSPAPSKSILISFLAIMRSFLSWLSISSFPAMAHGKGEFWVPVRREIEEKLTGFSLAIDSGRLNATHFGKLLQSCVNY